MAVIRTLRSVITAHAQSSYNRFRKHLGASGIAAMVIVIVLTLLFGIVPMFIGLAGGGYALGDAAFNDGNPKAIAVLGALLAGLAIGGGAIGGLTGGGKQLTWEQYRGYPVGPGTLFIAELFAGLGDVVTALMVFSVMLATFAAGLSSLRALPGMLALGLVSVVLLLATQLLVGGLADRLVRRLRMALALTFVLGGGMSSVLATQAAENAEPIKLWQHLFDRAVELSAWMPTVQAIRAIHDHRWLGFASMLFGTTTALGLAFIVLWRERETHSFDAPGARETLWGFDRPALGVARLQWVTLVSSAAGKFAFVMPLMTIVLIKGPFALLTHRDVWLVPSAFVYLSLAANGLGFNQFGLDGHGVKTLFLLPIGDGEILEGKRLGFAVWQGLQALLLAVLLAVAQRPPIDHLIAGVVMFVCFFLLQSVVGQRTSVWFPRRMGRGVKGAPMPLPTVLIGMGLTAVSSLVFGGCFVALATWLRPALVPVMLLLAGGLYALSGPLSKANARFLSQNRERIVDAVG